MTLDSAPHLQVMTFIRGEVVRADEQKDEPRALEVPVDDGSPMLASADLIWVQIPLCYRVPHSYMTGSA
jgi:hypothetical protein